MKSINDDWEYKIDNDDNDDDEDEDEDLKPLVVRSSSTSSSTSSSSVAAKPLEVLLSTSSSSSKSINNNVNTKLKGLQRKRKQQQQQHSIYTLLLLLLLIVVVFVFVTVYDNNQIIMPTTTKMKMNNNKNENLKHDDDDDDATTKTTTTTTNMMKQQKTTTTKKRISVGGGFCPDDFDFDEGFDNNENNNNTTERTTTTKVSLGFIHIRKTGGMAISSVGKQHNYGWGGKKHLQNSTLDIPNYSQASRRERTDIGNLGHIPPQFFIPYPFLKQQQKTFVVIRNPYDRAISEYYQGIKWYMNMKEINPQFEISGRNNNFPKNFDDMNNPNNMNTIIQNNILNPKGDSFIPQHLYIYKLLPTQQQQERLVDHVLRFENLKIEFDDLMDCYKLKNVTLPSQPVNGRQQTAILTTKNLTQETIKMINQYMKLDFELLNYTMM